jgi:hypothetical protein
VPDESINARLQFGNSRRGARQPVERRKEGGALFLRREEVSAQQNLEVTCDRKRRAPTGCTGNGGGRPVPRIRGSRRARPLV